MSVWVACAVCGAPATCFGAYEGAERETHACDTCCGHGNEDGWCEEIEQTDAVRARPKRDYQAAIRAAKAGARVAEARVCELYTEMRLETGERDARTAYRMAEGAWREAALREVDAARARVGTDEQAPSAPGST